MTEPQTLGVHHVGLAVPDLEAAVGFFVNGLGWKTVGGNPAYPAIFVSDGYTTLTLWSVEDPATATKFDRRKNVGLHHLALKVADKEILHAIFERLQQYPGVTIDSSPGPMSAGSDVYHFLCFMPGGVRLEFATPRS